VPESPAETRVREAARAKSSDRGLEEAPAVSMDEDLPAELEASRKQVDELLTKLKYLQAEFENYRKRADRDAEAYVRLAHEALLVRILPILDELDAGVDRMEGTAGEGVRMVRDKLAEVLGEAGLQMIPALGVPFDPYIHDCVEQVTDASAEDGVVKEVVLKGYRLADRVLRPARVIVVNNGGATNA